jgi:two-component system, NarL family, response regulator DevR
MIVDDHTLVRGAVGHALDVPDVELVGEAATAEEALRIAPGLHPDVLLVDINLPRMDGLSLVRELAPRLPGTRIVMLTVYDGDRELLSAVQYGAVGYLTKDVSPDALLRAVRGAAAGELAMGGQTAARLVRRLVDSSRVPASPEPHGLSALTDRESEILRLLSAGMTDREIGEQLTISPRTVQTHVSNILHKLEARNRAEAARRYGERMEGS